MMDDEWVAVWMLGIIKKRRKIDKYVYQSLRNVVKEGGVDVLKNFENKFKEMRVEGCRKDASSVMYTEDRYEDLPETHYTETELQEIDTMFMGTESEARKRYQRNGSYRRQSFGRQKSNSRDSRYGNFRRQSRFDGPRSGDGKNTMNRDTNQDFPSCSSLKHF